MNNLETIEMEGGNTKIPPPPSKKQAMQCLHWCFTWNNYIQKDIETLETLFRHLCHKWAFQEEKGENGTPHLQGVMSLKKRARWTEFGLPKALHWEKVINLTAAYAYATKEATRVGSVFTFNYQVKYIESITMFYEWEVKVKELLLTTPDNRTIHWFWEPKGCAGKTTFQKWVYTHMDNVVVLSGKGSDMKNGVLQYHKTQGKLPKIILINLPRTLSADYVSYTGIEEIKDCFFFSPKYEGGMICDASPHVLIFANEEPKISNMSADRWNVVRI